VPLELELLLLPHAARNIAAAKRPTANNPYFLIPIPSSKAEKSCCPVTLTTEAVNWQAATRSIITNLSSP
jgi:hypothetical protein